MSNTTVFHDASDIFSEVPASYPFDEALADNAADLAQREAEAPAPDPFAVTLADEAGTLMATKQSSTKSKG
jgi:hypothetical protein